MKPAPRTTSSVYAPHTDTDTDTDNHVKPLPQHQFPSPKRKGCYTICGEEEFVGWWNSERGVCKSTKKCVKEQFHRQKLKSLVLRVRELKPLSGALPLKTNSQKEVQEEKQPTEG